MDTTGLQTGCQQCRVKKKEDSEEELVVVDGKKQRQLKWIAECKESVRERESELKGKAKANKKSVKRIGLKREKCQRENQRKRSEAEGQIIVPQRE